MQDKEYRDIPGLGKVKIGNGFSSGSIQSALDAAKQTTQDKKGQAFSNALLSSIIIEPKLTPTEISETSPAARGALVTIAVKLLDIESDFDSLPPTLEPRTKLYQAFLKRLNRRVGSIIAAIAEKTQETLAETLSAIDLNVPGSNAHITNQMFEEKFGDLVHPAIASLQASLGPLASQVRSSLQGLSQSVYSVGKLIKQKYEEVELDAQAAAPLLSKANLWFPPSAPLALLRALSKVAENENPSPDQVEDLFLDYYGNNNWAALSEMVDSWEDIPHFKNRMAIIKDALKAHIEGMYTLSIPALLPQIEGVAGNILGMSIARKTKGHIGELLEEEYPIVFSTASKDLLIRFVTEVLYTGADYDNFGSSLESMGFAESDFLNRPAILHGVHINYANEGHSLRAFLLLDALGAICGKDDE